MWLINLRGHPTRRVALLTLAFLLALGGGGWQIADAQTVASASRKVVGDEVPVAFQAKVRALGDRFFVRGKERLTLGGSIQRPGEVSVPVTLTYEIPRKFRYQEGAKSIVFDGVSGSLSSATASADAALAESLFEDMIDGLLPNIHNGSLVRPLINRARLDDGISKGYSGPYLDRWVSA